MELYIPPKELTFRLQNYVTKWVIFSRFAPDPHFHHFPGKDVYYDQYWSLIPGTGKRSGYFRFENNHTKWSIYSRTSPEPQFDHSPGNDEYDDQYWSLVPGTGKYSGYFRIESYQTKWSIFSRFSQEPEFYHSPSNDEYDDQYWTFIFEDAIVESIDYRLDEGKIEKTIPVEIMKQSFVNDTCAKQTFSFKMDESITHVNF